MPIRKYNPTSPGLRGKTSLTFDEITVSEPYRPLTENLHRSGGRNNQGELTIWWRGGGHKRLYRIIDFKRDKKNIPGKIETVEYDPNRSARIALVTYADGEKRYILHPLGMKVGDTVLAGDSVDILPGNCLPLKNIPGKVSTVEYDPNRSARIALITYADGEKRYILQPLGIKVGDTIVSGANVDILPGNCLPLKNIPLGTQIHNVELKPGKGGQIARSAGSSVQLVAREGDYASVRMPSGEIRKINVECLATIGQVGNLDHENVSIGKAGRSRWLGQRPHVRGVAMNPVDHPLGGGEGKTSGGRHPVTPWGQPTKGYKTRRRKDTDRFIVQRRTK